MFDSGDSIKYGATYMTGDTIAVLLHLHPDGSRLEFFKNGHSQGIAFDKLPWEAVRDGYGNDHLLMTLLFVCSSSFACCCLIDGVL